MLTDIDGAYFKSIIDQAQSRFEQGRLPHALLFHSLDMINLEPLLVSLSAIVLQQYDPQKLMLHPDVHQLNGYESQIKIDALKGVLESIYLSAHGGRAKVIMITPLEALNRSSANALLKALEEPPENTYFLMVSYNLQWVLPTLRSRVQLLDVNLAKGQKVHYLQQQYQMTIADCNKALAISRGSLAVVKRIKSDPEFWQLRKRLLQAIFNKQVLLELVEKMADRYEDYLYWLQSFIIDCYYYALGNETIAGKEQLQWVQAFVQKRSPEELYGYYQRLLKLNQYAGQQLNVNKQLALEALLFEMAS